LAPVLALYYIPSLKKGVEVLMVGVGFIVITVLLGLVNLGLGEGFLFFLSSFQYAIDNVGTPVLGQGSGWSGVFHSPWLITYGVLLIFSVFYLNRISLCYIVLLIIYGMVNWKLCPALQSIYYTNYIIPVAALTLGGILSRWQSGVKVRPLVLTSITSVALIGLLLVNYIYPGNTGTKQQLEIVSSIEQRLSNTNLHFWYNVTEDVTYRAIACTHLWSYRLVSEDFPGLGSYKNNDVGRANAHIETGMSIVILSRDSDALIKANKELSSRNLKATFVRESSLYNINLTFVRIYEVE
jgi:hypothetical protein